MRVVPKTTKHLIDETETEAKPRFAPARQLAIALALVVVGAVAAVVVILRSTVPADALEDARAELEATEAGLAATEVELETVGRQSADAIDHAAALEAEIAGLQQTVSALEGSVAERDRNLADSRAEVNGLTADVAAAQERAGAAEATIASASGYVESLMDLSALRFGLETWGLTPKVFRDLERMGVDLATMDALVSSYRFADTWREWSVTDFVRAARRLEVFMESLDDPNVESAFDLWFDCSSENECVRAALALQGAIVKAESDLIDQAAEELGVATHQQSVESSGQSIDT